MKKLFTIFVIMVCLVSFAQETQNNNTKERRFSVSLSAGLEGFGEQSILNKSYENVVSTKMELTFPYKKNFSFGFFSSLKFPSIQSTTYIGESTSAKITEMGTFAQYNHLANNKLNIINKLGVSSYRLKNVITNDYKEYPYKTRGYKIFWSPELDYNINNKWAFFIEGNLGYIHLKVNANQNLDAEYNHHLNYGLSLGSKFKF